MRTENKIGAGFTILELLVVIAIISMMASFVFSSIGSARKNGRDARREEDIKQIQNALVIYATNMRLYPLCASEVVIDGSSDCLSTALNNIGATTGKVPIDPLNGSTGTCGTSGPSAYCYKSTDGFTYTIRYALETNTIPGKTQGWQSVGP